MELNKTLIATIIGGVGHTEDALFKVDLTSYIKEIPSIINKVRSEGKLKHDYHLSVNEDEDTKERSLLLQCLDEDKVKLLIQESAIIYNIGAILRQGNLFRKGSFLREIAVLIDEITKYRKPQRYTNVGVFPKFVIPLSKPVAPSQLKNMIFSSVYEKIGIPSINEVSYLGFKSNIKHKVFNIEIEIQSSKDKDSIFVFMDIRTTNEPLIKSYDTFLLKAKPVYSAICKGVVADLIRLDNIDEKMLLTKEVPSKSVEK